jgi:CD109 antigen
LATFKDEKIRIVVRSKYTYGKPVNGKVTLEFQQDMKGLPIHPAKIYTYYAPLKDGRAVIEIESPQPSRWTVNDQEYSISAVVKEELTGCKQMASAVLTVHQWKYKMSLKISSTTVKPGIPMEATVKIEYHDGTPVTDKNNPVEIREQYQEGFVYTHHAVLEGPANQTIFLDDNGVAKLSIIVPPNKPFMRIQAKYLEVVEDFEPLSLGYSANQTFIGVKVDTER